MGAVLITGSKGIIGSVLQHGLKAKYLVKGVDLPDDISCYETLWSQMDGVDTVIHLARKFPSADKPVRKHMRIYPQNVQIDVNIFTAVVKAGVKRLVMASSVHADHHRDPMAVEPLAIPGSYYPASPYGVYKLIGEEVGRALSKQFDFEFVGVRFGGVTRDDSVKRGEGQTATWLSHGDLLSAIEACLAADAVPGRSTVFYAVSNNADRIHDTANPFGWRPTDDSADRAPR
ncbi:MAG TPA: NAD(P)-dependent oxidoreductase [Solirubrobacteraceae bacterium]|jgi:nucleoside-diphosphate-sugar epimerase|nr:NAD(P)-dependent oxidoreductase [Solirubrobacteraceae bacterium]